MIEKKLYQMGFKKLQEKENRIYFEKNEKKEQLYIIYDKVEKRIKYMDCYVIENGEMKVKEINKKMNDELRKLS